MYVLQTCHPCCLQLTSVEHTSGCWMGNAAYIYVVQQQDILSHPKMKKIGMTLPPKKNHSGWESCKATNTGLNLRSWLSSGNLWLTLFFPVGLSVPGSIRQLFRGSYLFPICGICFSYVFFFSIFWVRFGDPKLPKTKKDMEIAKHEKIVKQIGTKIGGKVMHPEVRRAREHPPALSLLAVHGARNSLLLLWCTNPDLCCVPFFLLILFLLLFLLFPTPKLVLCRCFSFFELSSSRPLVFGGVFGPMTQIFAL